MRKKPKPERIIGGLGLKRFQTHAMGKLDSICTVPKPPTLGTVVCVPKDPRHHADVLRVRG
jgi:hypothetical protein